MHRQPAFPDGRCRRRSGADRPHDAAVGRLGYAAARRDRVPGKIPAQILDDGRSPCSPYVRRARLGGADSPWRWRASALAWITMRFGDEAGLFGRRVGLYAGLAMSTCGQPVSCFTRFQIPDAGPDAGDHGGDVGPRARARRRDEPHPASAGLTRCGPRSGWACCRKGLIAARGFRLPPAALYLDFRPARLAAAASVFGHCRASPGSRALWHILATLRNPPYFDFDPRTAKPAPITAFSGSHFINEQLLRFLNLRALPARLQHRAAALLLDVSSAVAVSLERVSGGCVPARPGHSGPRFPHAASGALLDWLHPGVFYVLPRRRSITRCPVIRRWRF